MLLFYNVYLHFHRSLEAAVFNVKDYGAKGDGANKDTAGINAALAACNVPLFWPVFYSFSHEISL